MLMFMFMFNNIRGAASVPEFSSAHESLVYRGLSLCRLKDGGYGNAIFIS